MGKAQSELYAGADLYVYSRHIFVRGNYPAISGSKFIERDLDKMAAKLDIHGNVEYWRDVRRFRVGSVDPLDKWCYVCGCTRPKSYFSPDRDRHDKLYPVCKECRNRYRRENYAAKKAQQGKAVRPYHRHDAEEIAASVA